MSAACRHPIGLGLWLGLMLALAQPFGARAAEAPEPPPVERVQVDAPFIELHTGPGRGFPVFHVATRHEWVEITLRHTDWYKVRTATGQQGWVSREEIAATLTEGGSRKTFGDAVLADYLKRRVEAGVGVGRLHGDPLFKFWSAVRVSDTLSIEGSMSQAQGRFASTDLWSVQVHAEPWSDQRLSPFVGVGLGHFRNVPNQSLVDNTTTSVKMADLTAGARWHLGERFVLRADYTIHTAFLSDQRSSDYRAATLGLSFFF